MRGKNKEKKKKNQMVTECVWARENNFPLFGLMQISIIIVSLNLLAVFKMLTIHD